MSREHHRKGLFPNRERDRDLDLPVPNYSERGLPMKPDYNLLSAAEKRRCQLRSNDNDVEFYKVSEPRVPSAVSQHTEDEYSEPLMSTKFPREQPHLSHGSKYQASVYNGMPATALAVQHSPDVTSMQQPPQPSPVPFHNNHDDQLKKVSAVSGQKIVPLKQVEDYKKKAALLREELDTLKDQRNELRGDGKRSPSPDTKRFLKENTKLQLEIQNKLNTINNVLDMLDGIVGDQTVELNEPEETERKLNSRSPLNQKFNYVYYDPEMHWCRVCDVFPPTAKDYLSHLHSAIHQKMAAEHLEAPWHSLGVSEGHPSFPSAPTKRIPIKGLQFFVPATAWYCKLCDQFIGDLHCASAHIKSLVHSRNYNDFVEHNPHWETDWMSDRQRAFERARTENKTAPVEDKTACSVKYTSRTITISKDFHNHKRLQKSPSPELSEKKKYKKSKRRSNSHSSSSESEDPRVNSAKNKRLKYIEMDNNKDLRGLNSPTPERLSDDDRKLLETLKSRMKRNREERQRSTSRERERIRDMQRRIRESERRGRSSEQRAENRDPRDRSRDCRYNRDDRPERRDDRPERRDDRAERRDDRPERRDRRDDRQNWKGDGRERRDVSRDHRGGSRDGLIERDQPSDSPAGESNQIAIEQPPLPALPLPPRLPAPPPLPATAPAPASLPPPVIMPPPRPMVPPGRAGRPVPPDFHEALEMLFPTDPLKCTEMLNAIQQQQQQPSLLGAPPPLSMFSPLALMQRGMLNVFPPPLLPLLGRQPRARTSRGHRGHKRGANRPPAGNDEKPQNDDLVMLGIEASDVGAGT